MAIVTETKTEPVTIGELVAKLQTLDQEKYLKPELVGDLFDGIEVRLHIVNDPKDPLSGDVI